MAGYDHAAIEAKWRAYWETNRTFATPQGTDKPKYYVLDMFPYPSGEGLHVGHPKGYTATDVVARARRMMGFNVLHPMGWDSLGLPAERQAVRDGVHPRLLTERNTKYFRKQLENLGLSYDWDRELATSDPGYYRWTQWIFLQLYRKGLAYQAEVPVNWCPSEGTVLSNEEVKDGLYVETGAPVEKRLMKPVDAHGDVFIAEATAQRVQEVRASSRAVVTVAGTGTGGFNGDGRDATASELDEPTGVAVDTAGDLFIADTANCRVRVLPAATGTLFGQAVHSGGLFTVAGTGVCGNTGQGGPLRTAQLWNPVAVTLDTAGDLLVADSGDQSVLLAPSGGSGTFYGSAVGAGDIGVVVGGTGSYGPYVVDGLPANGPTAELNDPRGLAIGPTGALFATDGFMHVIRVVPAVNGTLLGSTMKAGDLYTVAGALPVATAAGTNDDTKWVRAHMGTPVGIAVSASGELFYADATQDTVRVMATGAAAS